jgi:selenocysteine-specific elongation factor
LEHLIIGTAGHIDHGKTTLIKALTGIDCDRLKEEKERGITIDLGFAYFDLPSGRRAGIVDVPGHEKFIKNMLAGVHGMDMVMLIIDANEGIMPQTEEHLHILSMLDVKCGIIVLTKIDLVEKEWLTLVTEEVRSGINGTFLERSPIVPVSALTKEGLNELTFLIDELCGQVKPRDINLPFRMPIDRVFTIQGFGTVVTGTAVSGIVRTGDTLELHPTQASARVRGIRIHGESVELAQAGQRTALNLSGIKPEQLQRGDVLAALNSISPTTLLDVRLTLVPSIKRTLTNGERIRFHTGTAEILGRVFLLQSDELLPKDSEYAQIRLEEPVSLCFDDRFVIRTLTPVQTIGGGVILDPNPIKRKRFKEPDITELKTLESGSTEAILEQKISHVKEWLINRDEALRNINKTDSENALENLLKTEVITRFFADNKEYFIHRDKLEALANKTRNIVSDYHLRFPLRSGISREELRSRLMPLSDSRLFNNLLLFIQTDASIKITQSTVSLTGFSPKFEGLRLTHKQVILQVLTKNPYSPPSLSELRDTLKLSPQDALEIMEALKDMDEVIKISEGMYFLKESVIAAKDLILRHFEQNEHLSLADFRTLIGSSRKYALLLLEYFDEQRLTVRIGENRKLK